MSSDIGPRLRGVRERTGLSQRALARRSGISNATISLIESRKLNPSVAVLKRILDGIPMDLSSFFADEHPEVEPSVFRADELVEITRGKVSYRQVGHNLAGKNIQILHERYAPGSGTGKIALHHGGQEGGVVIRGRLELTLDGERFVLGAGDAYYFDSSRPHHFRNVGTDEVEIVSACSPPSV
ncbi:MAG: cupin domain-containing protein [Deltaproteobacteria bacterium]|nr:cupin domain-containing protein [Deltaproteobacteria bacterium]